MKISENSRCGGIVRNVQCKLFNTNVFNAIKAFDHYTPRSALSTLLSTVHRPSLILPSSALPSIASASASRTCDVFVKVRPPPFASSGGILLFCDHVAFS